MAATLKDYQRKVSGIKDTEIKNQEAQRESNLAMARYKWALVGITEV
jgi:hypothetical protein